MTTINHPTPTPAPWVNNFKLGIYELAKQARTEHPTLEASDFLEVLYEMFRDETDTDDFAMAIYTETELWQHLFDDHVGVAIDDFSDRYSEIPAEVLTALIRRLID